MASPGFLGRLIAGRRMSYLMPSILVPLQGLMLPLRRDDRGATAVEYALMATLIAVVIATAVAAVGTRLVTMFTNLANAF
jgi:pilus assembly protein Flp/PilA